MCRGWGPAPPPTRRALSDLALGAGDGSARALMGWRSHEHGLQRLVSYRQGGEPFLRLFLN